MNRNFQFHLVLALTLFSTCAVSFAQKSAQAIYKDRCLDCHGASGLADTKMARALKVKPITDPEIMKISQSVMIEDTKAGIPHKMPAYKGTLTDTEIKDVVSIFRSYMK